MADSKTGPRPGGRGTYTLELVGLEPGAARPPLAVQVVDAKGAILHAEKVTDAGTFSVPPDALKNARYVVIGAPAEQGVADAASVRFRPQEFDAATQTGTLALAEGIWSRFRFFWTCVSGSVRVCRRRPRWFDAIVTAVSSAALREPAFHAAAARALPASRAELSINDIVAWPVRCFPVCLGTVQVFRRTCCCWPLVIDDVRIADLVKYLESIVDRLPKLQQPKIPFPPPPPSPIDPFALPLFRGGALNELALNAPADLRALRSLGSEQAVQYINSRAYLLRHVCSCGRPQRVAGGSILPDGTFNICWLEPIRLFQPNCHDEYAYIVTQTIGGTTTTIYDGVAAGAWYHAGDNPVLTTYRPDAYSCNETGTGDGTAFVYLDLIGDTESYELTTPDATGWDRVQAPTATSGLLFPNAGPHGQLRNLGGSIELTYNFSEAMKDPSVDARYYRIGICRADDDGNPTGPRYYYGSNLDGANDSLTWQKAVVTMSGVDIVPEHLGPVVVGTEANLYKIPYNSDADWTGSVRYHARLNTLFSGINVPADVESQFGDPASNHLVTLEVFNSAGERIRPLGTAGSGQPGTEVAKPFKFRRWFQPEGSPGDDTKEVPFAALTHLFCWDNRAPRAEITRLVFSGAASDEKCQFLVGSEDDPFGIEYRAYVPDERFQYDHSIGWIRGLGATAANGGLGSLPTPLSPSNVGEPPAAAGTSGTNTLGTMLTSIDPGPPPVATVLSRCAFSLTLTTHAKTTDGGDLSYPYAQATAAFALEVGTTSSQQP